MRYDSLSEYDPVGHLEIFKYFPNGDYEKVFDDHNIIVSGMGLGLSYLFSLSGPATITEFQIDRFQLGVSGSTESSSLNTLYGPLSSAAEYGGDAGQIYTVSAYHALNTTNVQGPEWFGYIPDYKVSRVGENSVRYTITVDRESGNNLSRDGAEANLNEIGLFMKNPLGNKFPGTTGGEDSSVLVAYRHFSDIRKTNEFSLVFRWTITF